MNHGIIADETRESVGRAIWAFAGSSQMSLAVFADEVLQRRTTGKSDPIWSEAFVRSAGSIQWNPLPAAVTPYCRFEPNNEDGFVYMCRCCGMADPQWPALVVDSSVADANAIEALESLLLRQRAIARRYDQHRSIVPILQKLEIAQIGWGYFLGFGQEDPATIVIADNTQIVASIEEFAGAGNHSVLARW